MEKRKTQSEEMLARQSRSSNGQCLPLSADGRASFVVGAGAGPALPSLATESVLTESSDGERSLPQCPERAKDVQ